MNNDVLASLEMMLTFGQMMLCLTAQMKKSKPIGLDFLSFMDLIDASAKTLIFQGVSGFFDCFFGISEVFRSCLLIFEQKWI